MRKRNFKLNTANIKSSLSLQILQQILTLGKTKLWKCSFKPLGLYHIYTLPLSRNVQNTWLTCIQIVKTSLIIKRDI